MYQHYKALHKSTRRQRLKELGIEESALTSLTVPQHHELNQLQAVMGGEEYEEEETL